MKRITVPLLVGVAVAAVGCGKSEDAVTGSTAMSISGSLKTTSSLMLNASRIDQFDAWAASAPGSSFLLSYDEFLVSCVTFSIPPVAGTGGTVGTDGKFTVAFPEGTVGQSFGCFISKPADTNFDPIPMVFKDNTKKSMTGEAASNTRLAVNGSIEIPEVKLDLTNGTAEVDTATIVDKTTNTTTNVVKTATGTKFDFTGNWVIESLTANNITVPAGYSEVCSFDQMFEDEWNRMQTGDWSGKKACDGPIVGMKLYFQRMAGKNWIQDQTCKDAVAASKTSGTPVAACGGTQGTEDRYAIQLWAPEGGKGGPLAGCGQLGQPGVDKDTCKASMQAMVAGMDPAKGYHDCGRKMGFTNIEAKAFAEVDLSADGNYVASGSSSGVTDTHYYDGLFPFATSVDIPADLASACSNGMCGPFSAAGSSTITDGWKIDSAQTQWAQQNNCKPVDVSVGGKQFKAWRCYGSVYTDCDSDPATPCTPNPATEIAAFNEGTGGGCVDGAGKAINFNNWQDFWCNGEVGCNNGCVDAGSVSWVNPDGTLSPAGYNVQTCSPKSTGTFTPKDQNGADIAFTGSITCKSGGMLFKANPVSSDWTGVDNPWAKFVIKQANAGVLCKNMVIDGATQEEQNRQQLAKLQCYAQAYERARDQISGCTRDVRFNWGTQNPWEFVSHDDGPGKAKGEVIFELFNYTDANSGTFSTIETYENGVRVKDSQGYDSWVPCRINRSETITITSISATKMLVEMTSVSSLANKENATCVAAAAEGTIESGTSKGMFVVSKQ